MVMPHLAPKCFTHRVEVALNVVEELARACPTSDISGGDLPILLAGGQLSNDDAASG